MNVQHDVLFVEMVSLLSLSIKELANSLQRYFNNISIKTYIFYFLSTLPLDQIYYISNPSSTHIPIGKEHVSPKTIYSISNEVFDISTQEQNRHTHKTKQDKINDNVGTFQCFSFPEQYLVPNC